MLYVYMVKETQQQGLHSAWEHAVSEAR